MLSKQGPQSLLIQNPHHQRLQKESNLNQEICDSAINNFFFCKVNLEVFKEWEADVVKPKGWVKDYVTFQ